MKIQGRELTDGDQGSKVIYAPTHQDSEEGTISSWTDNVVFVDYGTGTNKATSPRDLEWG